MHSIKNILFPLLLSGFFVMACTNKKQPPGEVQKPAPPISPAALMRTNMEELKDIIVYDVFSPPVASRIYAYVSLAQYEAIRFSDKSYPSFLPTLHGFDAVPQPVTALQYNFTVAAVKAFETMALNVIFNKDSLHNYAENTLNNLSAGVDKTVYERSLQLGDTIGKIIWKRAAKDWYKETRGMAKYNVQRLEEKWQPTPPDYMDATEPWWNKIMPLALDSCSQCKPPAPYQYSSKKSSPFFKDALEVYNLSGRLTDSLKIITTFWDDNPFVMNHSGHAAFATKKMTPGGHWLAITSTACKKSNAGEVKTAQALAATSIALLDGFISCWDEKYRSEVVRPLTYISKHINPDWQPFLQTPPFPEYPSGHSVISASAAVVLTQLFGDHFSFTDSSELQYQGVVRSFPSFYAAAKEAGISRFYGGIHYMNAINKGSMQGKIVGRVVLQKLGMNK
ncbi:MAG: vanadium-dependent haloperoxidase [Aquabacterium sp.]|nr:vanadium-dependent haloperoxidase [Ferruginibacter sp.]